MGANLGSSGGPMADINVTPLIGVFCVAGGLYGHHPDAPVRQERGPYEQR